MFSIIRFILIVGAIFYYSPVRQGGEGTAAVEAFFTPKKSEPAAAAPLPAPEGPGHLETVWKALPDSAKQAVVDKILTTSGLNPVGSAKPADTLRPEDRELPSSKPRS
ncbi:hypothetical protein JKG68_19275 [Microvirga aerilata]|uniref:Uncharacterized protein n=1 Tax=Microvirga aerilata TaxID=670292 RepID=A0A936ZFA2_9HYPH|nr:hypothetical protein [Microvirga aerilata]MBL0406107.1 hypothetical protein [Microvirga aerilata]